MGSVTRLFGQRSRLAFARYVVDKAVAQGAEIDPVAVVKAAMEEPRRSEQTPIGRVFLWLLDQACLHTTEMCRAYGGQSSDGMPRVCDKPRWHWDSHTYEREDVADEAQRAHRVARQRRWLR